jgi:hypothetical protein
MWSNNVKRLLGVVYIPETTLIIEGTDQIAEESAWTVIVAEKVAAEGLADASDSTETTQFPMSRCRTALG